MHDALGRKIRMSFLEASDGPRVMLFGPLDVDIGSLQALFRQLGQQHGPVRFEDQEFIAPFGGVRLIARCLGIGKEEKRGSLKRVTKELEFEWERSPAGWLDLAELVHGLLEDPTAGHQYLARFPRDAATVVVSKGEYSDEVLSRARNSGSQKLAKLGHRNL